MTGHTPWRQIKHKKNTRVLTREEVEDLGWRMGGDVAALARSHEQLRKVLGELRDAADAYTNEHIGIHEFADAMDKAYAAMYPTPLSAGEEPRT